MYKIIRKDGKEATPEEFELFYDAFKAQQTGHRNCKIELWERKKRILMWDPWWERMNVPAYSAKFPYDASKRRPRQ